MIIIYILDKNRLNNIDIDGSNPSSDCVVPSSFKRGNNGELVESRDAEKVDISIYPNPATSELNIGVPEHFIGDALLLIDSKGQVVFQNVIRHKDTIITIAHLPQGIYLCRLGNQVHRILISR